MMHHDLKWDSSTGLGKVTYHKGNYHDAIHTKRNTVDLRIHNTFGGFNRSRRRTCTPSPVQADHGPHRV